MIGGAPVQAAGVVCKPSMGMWQVVALQISAPVAVGYSTDLRNER